MIDGTDPELPAVDIVDEPATGDAAKALEQSSGDPSSGAADTAPNAGLDGDPASSSIQEKRGRGRPPGAGKPFEKKPRPRGDPTLTSKELEKLRKQEVTALYEQAIRDKKALEEKLEDAQTRAAIGDVGRSEMIDDSIREACGFAAETAGNMAAAKWGPAARINDKQKEELARAWSRVAKIYLGEHAQYSPVAAALLATVAVIGEKYVDVQLAGGVPPVRGPILLSADG